ncbi:Non-specific lipid-transfer protein-like 2 [Parelaphostrongylus tenuis]|uniref:Sterol carrier protein 2 n=1 Tax=Parelaphostrongylus tenuis TaxID=148309 RepID=A0AAD5MSS9_PARTN|nr:Non-specific lipid-transfer protein-like 2 [Parelaphostrongylus tenuis]
MGKTKVYVIGVGMTKFCKPGSRDWDYPDMVKEAVSLALSDCSLKYTDIEMATVSYLTGGTCCGQRALYELGLTGIPIFNVNNACASGSSGVFLCKQIIESGNADCVLACGFEKMAPGSLDSQMGGNDDRVIPIDKHIQVISDTYGLFPAPLMAQMFGNAGKEHMEKYGTKREHFAKIAWKNHLHSVHNPNSQFTKEYTLDQVLNAKNIYDFMGLLECSPTSDGSAAAVICSERFLERHPHLKSQAVEIVGLKLGTDQPSVFKENSNIKMIGFDMIRKISSDLYAETGLTPNDVQVIELHDCFAPNELITYEALGLCDIGKGGTIVDRGDNTYGGKWVINPSGGLISKGHPIGATGVAQVVELSNQLRGKCGKRQVPNCKLALQHNIGIGGAGVVGFYRLGFPSSKSSPTVITKTVGAFKSDLIFQEIKDRISKDKDLLEKVDSSFKIIIEGNNGDTKKWFIHAKSKSPYVGHDEKPFEIEITIKDNDLMKIATGKLRADQAFMQGKMKAKGNIVKATKLKSLLDPQMLKSKF